jgi:hypothetical protein
VRGRPSGAPLLRSLLKKFGYTDTFELHDKVFNGITLIGKPKEGVGWPSQPDVAAPLPYHVLFLVSFMTVLYTANLQKESVGRANLEEILRAEDQVRGDPALRDKGQRTWERTSRSTNGMGRPDGRLPGQSHRGAEQLPPAPDRRRGLDSQLKIRRGEDWARSGTTG